MDLHGAGGYQRFDRTSWCKILELAYSYSWRPQGTEPGQWYDENGELCKQISPDPDTWDSNNYFSNDYQWVTETDAANIADALQQALDDIPDFDTSRKWVQPEPDDLLWDLAESPAERAKLEQGFFVDLDADSLSPVDYFSGEVKQIVRDFIRFCQAGAFCIA